MAQHEMNDTPKEIVARLADYLAKFQPGIQVIGFQFLASGVESEIYTFHDHPSGGAARPLILRLYNGAGTTEKQLREVHGIRRLHQAGFPVANILHHETDPAFLGKPFTIMEKLEGDVLWSHLYQVSPEQANHLLDRFGGLLARLHAIDWRPFTDQPARYETHPHVLIDEALTSFEVLFKKFDVEGFITVVRWLDAQKSKLTVRPAVVHLDFHANNIICRGEHLSVIDWTQISVGDYRSDLSWTLMIMGDFGQPHWQERILQAYRADAQYPVEDLAYFDLMTDLKLLASSVISLRFGPAVLGMRPETSGSAEQQSLVIRRLSRRIQDATGIAIPEVEQALRALGR